MANEIQKQNNALATLDGAIISSLVINGDLKSLTPTQKVAYYNYRCNQVGLDPSAKPFDLLVLNGKHVLYANASCTQQLCSVHKLSTAITHREAINGIYTVAVKVCAPDGRCTENMGAVHIEGLKGDALANAMMKATTKAIRRTVLAHCGLGMMDETELETIPGAKVVQDEVIDMEPDEITDAEMLDMWESEIAKCKTMAELGKLYKTNSAAVEASPAVKSLFAERKAELKQTA